MDQVEEVKSKVDIVEVISTYVPLKRAGRNMSGLCPFHGEKTPSFMVSPERQVFKCFGCGEGGDVIAFLEKIEGWDFREVLEELAKRGGVKLKAFAPTEGGRQKEKILAVNALAGKFYSYLLNKHKIAEPARKYLEKREIKPEIWKKFGLGYAPDSWEKTYSFLAKRGFSVSDIAASGLVVAREGREKSFYDRFRGRLIFPLSDARGQILGFSGRTIVEGDHGPKYVNSPETVVFNKGSVLFGLDLAREYIRQKQEALLVEGEFDAISAYQAGITNVVASKGTALTDKQIAILARTCESVALCFDEDIAGDRASRRGIELMDAAGLVVKVVRTGEFKDPDEFIKKDPIGFAKAVVGAENVYDFFMESAVSRFDSTTAEGKKKIGEEVLPVISKISDDMVRAHYISKLSKVLELDVSLISEAVAKRSGSIAAPAVVAKGIEGKVDMEKYFLALYLTGDKVFRDFFEDLNDKDLAGEMERELWSGLRVIINNPKVGTIAQAVSLLPDKFKPYVDNLFLLSLGEEVLEEENRILELSRIAKRIREKSLKRQMSKISNRIKESELAGRQKDTEELTFKFKEIAQTLKGEKSAS